MVNISLYETHGRMQEDIFIPFAYI